MRQPAANRWEIGLLTDSPELATYRWETAGCLEMGDSWLLTDGRQLTAYRWETAGCLEMGDSWLLTKGRQATDLSREVRYTPHISTLYPYMYSVSEIPLPLSPPPCTEKLRRMCK